VCLDQFKLETPRGLEPAYLYVNDICDIWVKGVKHDRQLGFLGIRRVRSPVCADLPRISERRE
jgi:hypothetical protein